MGRVIKVKGKENLAKTGNGSVVNTDSDSYQAAKARKQRLLEEQRLQQTLVSRVEELEAKVKELEERLK